jgi:predicted aspartyl protease
MIYGVVNLRRKATLPLVVGNINKQQKVIDTVIDTGFSGFLSLLSSIITALDLPWSASVYGHIGRWERNRCTPTELS